MSRQSLVPAPPVHITVILDRSGSMSRIASDIVGGFNALLGEQREASEGGRLTLVQFDDQDPFELLIDGEDLAKVRDLEPGRYQPRGLTPLFDAVGSAIGRVDEEILTRADAGIPIEDQIVVIITDGFENASREFDGPTVAELIRVRKGRAWTFVFLGSDPATFEEASRIGVSRASTAQWQATRRGSEEAMRRLSQETSTFRAMTSEERVRKSNEFFGDSGGGDTSRGSGR